MHKALCIAAAVCLSILPACGGGSTPDGGTDAGSLADHLDASRVDVAIQIDTPVGNDVPVGTDAIVPADTARDSGSLSDTTVRTDGSSDTGSTISCGARPARTGDGTYYSGDGTGACSFAARSDMLFAAMNAPDFNTAGVCGMCARVTGPSGEVTVTITDLCPECLSGSLDLSPTAFMRLSPLSAGRIPITWHEVPCDVTGPVVFHVYTGTNPYYLAINVRNHRNRLANLQRRLADGSWHALTRQSYNVWIESPSDAPLHAAHLRATDTLGATVEGDVAITANSDANADRQFPTCTP